MIWNTFVVHVIPAIVFTNAMTHAAIVNTKVFSLHRIFFPLPERAVRAGALPFFFLDVRGLPTVCIFLTASDN
jgi:hypothetical protein